MAPQSRAAHVQHHDDLFPFDASLADRWPVFQSEFRSIRGLYLRDTDYPSDRCESAMRSRGLLSLEDREPIRYRDWALPILVCQAAQKLSATDVRRAVYSVTNL